MMFSSLRSKKLIQLLKDGAIGVVPTDTIYGISCSALDAESTERVYRVRGRDRTKPFIILISSIDDIVLYFDQNIAHYERALLEKVWPAPVSIILPCPDNAFRYLHRGVKSLAFRIPDDAILRALLKKTGPLITTSANPEGSPPATTIAEARGYFGDQLDFYVDVGECAGQPSTLLRFDGDELTVLRKGSHTLSEKQ